MSYLRAPTGLCSLAWGHCHLRTYEWHHLEARGKDCEAPQGPRITPQLAGPVE